MCGIVGVVESVNDSGRTSSFIADGLLALSHRGPDDSGHEAILAEELYLGLGHRRLSILGVDKSGHQPMSHECLTIVFNGEIYNYRELCEEYLNLESSVLGNDTELILRLWDKIGPDSLKYLRGIFAFAIYDSEIQSLYLVRDSFGVKPLYYKFDEKSLWFSSEAKVIAEKSGGFNFDQDAACTYLLRARYDLGSRTFFDGVVSQEPGTVIEFSLTGKFPKLRREGKYVNFDLQPRKVSFDDEKKKVRELFLQAVERNLVSDVPVTFALSGGLDSSAIVSSARYIQPKAEIEVFSYEPANESLSEMPFVEHVAEVLNLKVNKCTLDEGQALELFHDFLIAQGEPVQSSRQMAQYVVFQEAARKGYKVLIEGQGGDEVLAGYHGFVHLRILDLLRNGQPYKALQLMKSWKQSNPSYPSSLPIVLLGQALVDSSLIPLGVESWARDKYMNDNAMRLASKSMKKSVLRAEKNLQNEYVDYPTGTLLKRGLFEATTRTYLPQLLRQGDRNAMTHSVENRVPFLDEDFAQYIWSLPDEFLLSNKGVTKHIFREAIRGIVPDKIIDRKDKVGFSTDAGLLPPEIQPSHSGLLSKLDLDSSDAKHTEASLWRRRSMRHWLSHTGVR